MKMKNELPGYYTVYESSKVIGVTHSQVCRYIRAGNLFAIKIGSQYLIPHKAVKEFKRRPVGNPRFSAGAKKKSGTPLQSTKRSV